MTHPNRQPSAAAVEAAKTLTGCGWVAADLQKHAPADSYALAVLRVAEHLESLSNSAREVLARIPPGSMDARVTELLESLILSPATPEAALRKAMRAALAPGKEHLTPNQCAQHVENSLRRSGYKIVRV